MIHYHGGPVTPLLAAVKLWTARHACVSFAAPKQVALAFEVAQSVMLDCGAFTAWESGAELDVAGYAEWVESWARHPAFDFALIPDSITGGVEKNRELRAQWFQLGMRHGVPVWHLDEPLAELRYLADAYPRVALGSSGVFAEPKTTAWWARMGEAMAAVCDEVGRPRCKLHGLRMLDPTVFSHIPLASADSTNVARNVQIHKAWAGPYRPVSEATRCLVLAERVEVHVSAARWNSAAAGVQSNLELIG